MRCINLSNGGSVLVDDDDYDCLNKWTWHLSRSGYARRWANRTNDGMPRKYIWMHRLINNTPNGMLTDHIDGNKLNNCRSNLRTCTYSLNTANSKLPSTNTSGYKGVYWSGTKWIANIQVNSRKIYLGSFNNAEIAASKYAEAASLFFGEFARAV